MPLDDYAEEITETGRGMDENITEEAVTLAPEGRYSVNGLNSLVDALNEVLPLFQLPEYDAFGEEISGPLPEDFVRQILMVGTAAEAAGLEALDLTDVVDDRGLEILAGRLKTYARDRGFQQFLKETVTELGFDDEEEITETDTFDEEVTPTGTEEETETETLFASRI